jgi:hypothetical protein
MALVFAMQFAVVALRHAGCRAGRISATDKSKIIKATNTSTRVVPAWESLACFIMANLPILVPPHPADMSTPETS